MKAEERVIVALDVPTTGEALAMVERVGPRATWFKVGMGLFTAVGPEIVHELRKREKRVFVDLKFHDIPTQVALASQSVARIGASLMNVHASAGFDAMNEARKALADVSAAERLERPLIVAVTLLTSLGNRDDGGSRMSGAEGDVGDRVLAMARVAQQAGLDGVVCSGHEVRRIKEQLGGAFVTVVPGIRPAGSSTDDQRRILTPGAALLEGADYLVIGRPITAAKDPATSFARILEEMEGALATS